MTKQAFLGIWLAVVSTASRQQHAAASLVKSAAKPAPMANLVDFTRASGVRFKHSASHPSKKYFLETMGPGMGLLDFDNRWCGEPREGYRVYCQPDLFPPASPPVYHNDRKGHFTEVSTESGISVPGMGVAFAISGYDREGMPDIATIDLANQKYALNKNYGDGTFTSTSNTAGIGSMSMLMSGWGICFLDYDKDGLNDLLVAQGNDLDNIALTSANVPNKEPILLAHTAESGFVEVSADAGPGSQQAWAGRGRAVGDIYNDSIEVRWTSGIRQTLKDVHVDQMRTVDEPTGVVAQTQNRMWSIK